MSPDIIVRRRLIGTVAAISLFTAWILIDLFIFPMIGISANYPLYELVTYGSWVIITLIVFLLLSWAGWFPMRSHDTSSDSTLSEA